MRHQPQRCAPVPQQWRPLLFGLGIDPSYLRSSATGTAPNRSAPRCGAGRSVSALALQEKRDLLSLVVLRESGISKLARSCPAKSRGQSQVRDDERGLTRPLILNPAVHPPQGHVPPLVPAISNCGAAHPSGDNRFFRSRLSRGTIRVSSGRNCRI
jgi:hypothetical protein